MFYVYIHSFHYTFCKIVPRFNKTVIVMLSHSSTKCSTWVNRTPRWYLLDHQLAKYPSVVRVSAMVLRWHLQSLKKQTDKQTNKQPYIYSVVGGGGGDQIGDRTATYLRTYLMALIDEHISTLTRQLSCRSDHTLYGTNHRLSTSCSVHHRLAFS